MAADPKKLTDPEKVRNLMNNAQRAGEIELVSACRRRLFELSGVDESDPLDRRLWQAVAALEETLREKHGRTQVAGYTRRKIKDAGAVSTLTDWAMNPKETAGFVALVAAGMADFTGEYVVAQFSDRFPQHVVEAARARLIEHGVALPTAA